MAFVKATNMQQFMERYHKLVNQRRYRWALMYRLKERLIQDPYY